jgi:predicted small integral membrane protein
VDLGDGSLAAGAVAAAGFLCSRAWRLFGRELWRVARTAVEGRLAVKRDRARGDRIVAVVTALPAGAKLVDQAADGSRLTICLSPPCSGTQGSPP